MRGEQSVSALRGSQLAVSTACCVREARYTIAQDAWRCDPWSDNRRESMECRFIYFRHWWRWGQTSYAILRFGALANRAIVLIGRVGGSNDRGRR